MKINFKLHNVEVIQSFFQSKDYGSYNKIVVYDLLLDSRRSLCYNLHFFRQFLPQDQRCIVHNNGLLGHIWTENMDIKWAA